MEGPNGYYSDGIIELSSTRLNNLEKTLSQNKIVADIPLSAVVNYFYKLEKTASLSPVYMTILHETVHYGDYLDGARQDGDEPGDVFEINVWGIKGREKSGEQFSAARFIEPGSKYNMEEIMEMVIDFLNSDTDEDNKTLPTPPGNNK